MNTRVETKHLLSENTSPYIKRLVLMKRSGIPLDDKQKRKLERFNETVSMVSPPPKHERDKMTNRIFNGNDISDIEDELELGDSSEDDVREYVRDVIRQKFHEEMEEDDFDYDLQELIDELEDEMMMDEILEELGYELGQKLSENFGIIYVYIMLPEKKNYYIKKEKSSSTKWRQKSGQSVDDIIFTDGVREISFDEWLQEEYKTK